jgi:acyl-CoA dehydrogenase
MSNSYAATFDANDYAQAYPESLFWRHQLNTRYDEFADMARWLRENAHHCDADLDFLDGKRNVPVIEQLVSDRTTTVAQRTLLYEIFSYGDMNSFFSSPNVSLSGILLRELGSKEQQDSFFTFVAHERCRTFFGVTEPDKGSDAANVQTRYKNGVLTGSKWLVGSADSGLIGTVLCRTGDSPMDRCTLLLDPEVLQSPKVKRQRLAVAGFSGALISRIDFEGLPVPPSAILGQHLRPLERGVLAIIKTFHRMRTCVAAMALGQAQAILHYAKSLDPAGELQNELGVLQTKLNQARLLNFKAAKIVDKSPLDRKWPSTAKLVATQTCEETMLTILKHLEPGALLQHPFLLRAFKNCFGFEFMEGVSVVQRNHIFAATF